MIVGAPIRKPSGPRPRARLPGPSRPSASSTPRAASTAAGSPTRRCNACFNALDRQVEAGRGDQAALYYDSPVAKTKRTITYRELLDETATLAAVLEDLGVAAGDRVLIYMPMIPEAIVAMLACARIGAVHSVVFGGFAAKELATRIDDAEPKVVLTASCGIEPGRIVEYKPLLDLAIGLAGHKPATCVVYQRPQIEAAHQPGPRPRLERRSSPRPRRRESGRRCADLAATDPLYILYTSGTTGVPKGVVRDIGGYLVALKWSMSAIYDLKPGETFWTGLRHRLGRRPFLHRLRAAAFTAAQASFTRASRSERPTPAPSGG